MTEKEKVVPSASVGADAGRPIPYESEISIAQPEADGKKNFSEIMREYNAFTRQHDPNRLHAVTITELMEEEHETRPPILDGLLYPGVYLLAGAEKIGKSFLALQLAYTVATGQSLWGLKTSGDEVLYLALEDTNDRLQRRFFRMFDTETTDRMYIAINCKHLSEGLVEELESYRREHPHIRLIIIDTLQKIREAFADWSYAKDSDVIYELKQYADANGLCILLVHHTRKQKANDVFEMISGTRGLGGSADGEIVMCKQNRTDPYATLQTTGRDVIDQKLYLKRDPKRLLWELERMEIGSEIEPPDPLYSSLDAMLTPEHPQWEGTASELKDVLQTERSAKSLGMWLKIHRQELMTRHGIRCTTRKTRERRTITLMREA